MNPATLKKAELIELAQLLNLKFVVTFRKDQIESIIRDHLLSHREDVSRDKRLQLFTIPPRVPGTRMPNGSDGSPRASHRASRTVAAAEDSEAASLNDEDAAPNKVKQRVDAGVAHVKETLAVYQDKTQEAVSSWFSGVQHHLSTVAATNVLLVLAEYTHLIYTEFPGKLFGTWHYGLMASFDSLKLALLHFTGILILVPLVLTFVLNFTKMDSIRRRKHAYLVDPILFGVTRFYIAVILFVTNYAQLRRYAILAGASGLSSAIIGVYASILQTS